MSVLIQTLVTISELVYPIDTVMFITSTNWELLVNTLATEYHDDFVVLNKRMTRENFSRLQIGKLLVVTSGTEDQGVCDYANQEAAAKANFRAKADRAYAPDVRAKVDAVWDDFISNDPDADKRQKAPDA